MSLSDIAILNIKGSNYYCIISGISKNGFINLMQNTDLTENEILKMGKEVLTLSNIEVEENKFYCFNSLLF